jgi:DNA polymerase-3 subunit beta
VKLSVTQENLNKALATVSRVALARSTLPILSNILLKTQKGRLIISATNLELAITQEVVGKVEKDGKITVPARLTSDFVASLPGGKIDMELSGTKLKIQSEHSESTINGTDPTEFPTLPRIENDNKHKIKASSLKKAINQTVICASNDETRPILTGVYFYSHEGELLLVSTDSYRLAEKIVAKTKDDISLIVPATALQELNRVIEDNSEIIEVTFDDSQVRFVSGDSEVITKLIPGKYPDYRSLIPAESDVQFTVYRDEFINITKVASLFARESAGSITISVSEEGGEISITSVASQMGENTSTAKVTAKGTGEITLNSRYLIDALNSMSSKEVSMRFSGKVNPCVITPISKQKIDYQHIIMPLKS